MDNKKRLISPIAHLLCALHVYSWIAIALLTHRRSFWFATLFLLYVPLELALHRYDKNEWAYWKKKK